MSVREEVARITSLALQLGSVNRATVGLGGRPETDNDHSISLAWVASSIAMMLYPKLDRGLVCQFAVVHDAVEVYAGDLPAVSATPEERAVQKSREHKALLKLCDELAELSWLPSMIRWYEAQDTPEARFVKILDKLMPKIVNRLSSGSWDAGVFRHLSAEEITAFRTWEREIVVNLAGDDFLALVELLDELNDERLP